MAFRPSTPELLPSTRGDTFSIRGWKVFAPGYWKGQLFGKERIRGIIDTWKLLKNLIPLQYAPKFRQGHDLQKRLTESLGLPNIGTVCDMRMTPDGGFEVDIENIPKSVLTVDEDGNSTTFDLQKAIQNGNYDGGSVELKPSMPHPTDPRQKLHDVFDGVSLLGEEHPAIRLTDSPSRHVYSADGSTRLAFSDFSEDPPMPLPTGQPDKKKQLADAMGMDVNDPAVQSLTDEQIDAFLDQVGSQKFSDCMKKKFAADLPTAGANPPPPIPGDEDPNAPVTKQMFADMQKQMYALEAANTDLKSQLQGNAGNGMVTMSEAHRRVEAVVKGGKLSPQLLDAKKDEARTLIGLPAAKLCFSDGAHKGRSQIAVFLEELEARPVDAMFSESIADTTPNEVDQPLSTLGRLALEATANGRAILRKTQAA